MSWWRRLAGRDAGEHTTREIAFAAAPVLLYPAGGGRVLAASPEGATLVTAEAAEVLARLAGVRTLTEHAAALELGDHGADSLAGVCSDLLSRGLLVTRDRLVPTASGESAHDAAEISAIVWMTHARPAALERSIRGFAENAFRHGRRPDLLVFDDGTSTQSADTLAALRPLVREGPRILYCGAERLRLLADRLRAASGVAEEEIQFALEGLPDTGVPLGARRNGVLLATAGRPVLCADDDTVCAPVIHPKAIGALTVTSVFHPEEVRYWRDREELLAAIVPENVDMLGAHERLLGRSVTSCAAGNALRFEELSPELIGLLLAAQPRVALTSGGLYGDSGIDDPAYALWLEGPSREALVRSQADYRLALHSREVLRCTTGPALGDGGYVCSANMGLDGRRLLPPFFPTGRGEEMLFGTLLRVIEPEALIGRPGIAVYHSPVEPRALPADPWTAPRNTLYDILNGLVRAHRFAPFVRTPEERLLSLGRELADLAFLGAAEFAEWMAPRLLSGWGARIAHAEDALHRHRGEPTYWARDVERYADLVRMQAEESLLEPAELRRGRDSLEAAALLQDCVSRFGRLLCAWPAVWNAACSLTADGEVVS